ncbi:MAG: hypothetical protein GC159_19855 [Phycisphaera sp.]|nr:hypothetical protein [Phycisphaera sp.]
MKRPTPGEASTEEAYAPARAAAAPQRKSTTTRRASAKKRSSAWLVFLPFVLIMGLALLLLAAWGTAVLTGMDVWRADSHNARTMAKLMMVCWPLSLLLLGIGGYVGFTSLRKSR